MPTNLATQKEPGVRPRRQHNRQSLRAARVNLEAKRLLTFGCPLSAILMGWDSTSPNFSKFFKREWVALGGFESSKER